MKVSIVSLLVLWLASSSSSFVSVTVVLIACQNFCSENGVFELSLC